MVRWRMSHKQRRREAELGPAGTAGPAILSVSTNCKFFFLFGLIMPLANNVVGLAITLRVIGASPRRNGVCQRSRDPRSGSG